MNSKPEVVQSKQEVIQPKQEVVQPKPNIQEEFAMTLSQLNGLKSLCSSVINQIKGLEKNVKKQMKQYQREIKKQSKQIKKKPSGFAVPTKVSEKLSKFMGLTEGQQVARTEVTKYIINYIKTNNLQNPNNNQCIIPDTKLNTLFDNNNEEITYFNIQKHMNKHFIK
jgi:chromatin remodeling complex protein RSC6